MPISLTSSLVPANGNTFALVEDIHVKGGLRTVSSMVELTAIPSNQLKTGSLVLVEADKSIYKYSSVTTSWTKTTITPDIASALVIGGVKVGSGLAIDANGVLSVTGLAGVSSFNSRGGAVTLNSSDVITALGFAPISAIPTASASTLGGVKVGSGLSINASGVLSAVQEVVISSTDPGAIGAGKIWVQP